MTIANARAVVLGGSIAGLLAARVLSETFARVTVFDRDDLTATGPRKGVPQGQHAHIMLAKGRELLEELFPGLTEELAAGGALPIDIHGDLAWHNGPRPMTRAASDVLGLSLSRPALEDYIRSRVAKLSNVDLRGGREATGLIASADRGTVTGVRVIATDAVAARAGEQEIPADLVIDATGRGNRGSTWLTGLGYPAPAEETMKAGVVYATREYERRPLAGGALGVLTGVSPAYPYGVAVLPMEGDRWIVTLAGFGDDIPPTDVPGFEAFALRLPIAGVAEVIRGARPLIEPKRFRVPASIRRRYDRLGRHPEGYLAFGDAICAFNPLYGQGMTVAALEAVALRECLRRPGAGLPRRFYAAAAKIIETPWDMGVGGDLAIPSVPGKRTAKIRFLNAYIARVLRAAEVDPVVALAFHRTVNLTRPPGRLFRPGVLRRVLFPARPVG